MSISVQTRAFRQPARPASETPGLIRRESWDDVGFITIGPTKSYGYRCYPGHGNCTRIVRLFCGNGFEEAAYDVCFFRDRPATCDCADAVYRRKDETGETCKHTRAVTALGLHKTDAEFEADELDRLADVPVVTDRKRFERFEAEFA